MQLVQQPSIGTGRCFTRFSFYRAEPSLRERKRFGPVCKGMRLIVLSLLLSLFTCSTAQDVLSSELARINTHAPAPAPELSLLAQAATAQPESVPAAGRVDPVSAPVLAALVPVAGQLRPTVNESVQTVSSAVPSIVSAVKEAGHDISSIFTGRKLLEQISKDKPLRLAGRPYLKAQHDKAQEAVAAAHAEADESSHDSLTPDQENAAIEQELVRIKEARLKKIQALPSTVWT